VPRLDQNKAVEKAKSHLRDRRVRFNVELLTVKSVKLVGSTWEVILFAPIEKLVGKGRTYTIKVDDRTGKTTDFWQS
jgi:hypothetical protein